MDTLPKKVFISYAQEDQTCLEEAKKHLFILEQQQLIKIWDDTKVPFGREQESAMEKELAIADIVLFLISVDAINTAYIWDYQVNLALERFNKGEVIIIPVIIKDCSFEDSYLDKFEALPSDGRAIASWKNQDKAWKEVVKSIKKIVSPESKKSQKTLLEEQIEKSEIDLDSEFNPNKKNIIRREIEQLREKLNTL